MAPRFIEPREAFLKRLQAAVSAGAKEVRFGAHHYSHVVKQHDGRWQVCRLEVPEGAAERELAAGRPFMPETAEALSVPGAVEFDAATLDELMTAIRTHAEYKKTFWWW